jgi:hypothetical protein
MREFRSYGSVRGALSNERPYRDPHFSAQSCHCEERSDEAIQAARGRLRSPYVGTPGRLSRDRRDGIRRIPSRHCVTARYDETESEAQYIRFMLYISTQL